MSKAKAAHLAAQIQKPNPYVWEPIAHFLCRKHNVSDVTEIVPFGKATYTWEVMRDVTLGAEVQTGPITNLNIRTNDPETQCIRCPLGTHAKLLDSPQPKKPFVHPVTGEPMPIDESDVCIYNITCRNVKSSVPIPMAPRLNYYHVSMAELQNTTEMDAMFKEAGAVKGAFTVIETTGPDGKDIEALPLPELKFGYQNSFFVRTFALVTESNLMNGIIEIPHDVCVAAKLPVWTGPPEPPEALITKMMEGMQVNDTNEQRAELKKQWTSDIMEQYKDAPRSHTFFAVPINHVLAWGYHSEDFMAQRGHRAEQFRYTGPDQQAVVLYYLVPSAYFESILKEFREKWMNKIDRRSLRDVGVEFLPILAGEYKGIPAAVQTVTGSISLRTYISYVAAPKLSPATIRGLAPALAPGFPSSAEWSVDRIAQLMAIEKGREKAAKTVRK